MNYKLMRESVALYVTDLFGASDQVKYPYHNLAHTKAVVDHAEEIAAFYQLGEKDTCILITAAWFHDTGQLYGDMQDHEERSVLIMNDYLKHTDAPAEFMQSAGNCIMATKCLVFPYFLIEKIICDADTYHFGTAAFHETEFLIEKEMEIRTGEKFPQWHTKTLKLLQDHFFYTEYCQLLLKQGKQENIAWLESLVNKDQAGHSSN